MKNINYQSKVTRMTVNKIGEPFLSEMATHVQVEDEGAGTFVVLQQFNGHGEGGQRIAVESKEEWEAIKEAVEYIFQAND